MIREFTEYDIPAAAEAEKLCFSVPWSEVSLRMLTQEPGCGLVYCCDGTFAAYAGMLCVAGEAQLLNIATLPEYRRRGIARELLSSLCETAVAKGCTVMTLEVRESNAAAKRLYDGEGFYTTGRRPGYYMNPREAAIIMEKKL